TGAGTYDRIFIGGDEDLDAIGVVINTGAGHDQVTLQTDADGDEVETASIDFGPGGTGNTLGLGNELTIYGGGTATLQKYPGSADHPIVVDTITVSGTL